MSFLHPLTIFSPGSATAAAALPCPSPQTLLDDPDLPGYQPALPRGFSLQDLAREVEAEEQERARRRRSPF
jgi:hypothetical protein